MKHLRAIEKIDPSINAQPLQVVIMGIAAVLVIAKGWRSRDLHQVRLLGGGDKTVWFNAGGSGGVDIRTLKLLGAAELRLSSAPQAPRGSSKFPFGNSLNSEISVCSPSYKPVIEKILTRQTSSLSGVNGRSRRRVPVAL